MAMGYYKDRFTHWGTCAERNEDVRINKRDQSADDRKFVAGPAPVPFVRPYFCKVQMIGKDGFNWGSAIVAQHWQYDDYRAKNPTWSFFDFQNNGH